MDELPTGCAQNTEVSNKHLRKESEKWTWEQHVASSRVDDVQAPVSPFSTSSAGWHRFTSCRSPGWLPFIRAWHSASDAGCWTALVVSTLLLCTKTGAAEPLLGGRGTSPRCRAVSGSAWAASCLLDSPIIVTEKPSQPWSQCHSSKTRRPHQTGPLTACGHAVWEINICLLDPSYKVDNLENSHVSQFL